MPPYTMTIKWSVLDNCFVVILPDFERIVSQPCADGKTYQEATQNGYEVLESLIEVFSKEGTDLPSPSVYL